MPISPRLLAYNQQIQHMQQQHQRQQQHSQSLPATPKSVNDSNHTLSNVSESSPPDVGMDDDDQIVADDGEYDEDDRTVDEQQFVLAPTPAQLGRAPLQRRLGSLGSVASTNDLMKADGQTTQHLISNVSASMPSALPTPNSAAIDDAHNPLSPNLKRPSLFKKHKGEDLNK